jgi:hypothetical protein
VLTNASGKRVPIVLSELAEGRLVQLQSSLPAGMYTLTYESTCTGTAKSVPTQFEVVEASPLPTVVGTVQVGAPTRQTITVADSSWCSAHVLADVMALSITYAPELVPFLPVATHTLLIDGEEWISTAYGSKEVNIPGSTIRQVSTIYRRLDIERLDIGPPYWARLGWDPGIGPGHHQAELIVTVAGMTATLPSVLFEFDFPELAAPDSGVGQPDSGVGQPDSGVGQPDSGVGQPDGGVGQPDSGVGQPDSGVGQPDSGVGQPDGGVGQPVADAGTPLESVDQPHGGGSCSFVFVSRPASALVLLGEAGLFALVLRGKNKRRRP